MMRPGSIIPLQHIRKLMSINLNGLLLPITTPFTADEAIDLCWSHSQHKEVDRSRRKRFRPAWAQPANVNLDESEYVQVIETLRAAVPQTLHFYCGGRTTKHAGNRQRDRAGRNRRG